MKFLTNKNYFSLSLGLGFILWGIFVAFYVRVLGTIIHIKTYTLSITIGLLIVIISGIIRYYYLKKEILRLKIYVYKLFWEISFLALIYIIFNSFCLYFSQKNILFIQILALLLYLIEILIFIYLLLRIYSLSEIGEELKGFNIADSLSVKVIILILLSGLNWVISRDLSYNYIWSFYSFAIIGLSVLAYLIGLEAKSERNLLVKFLKESRKSINYSEKLKESKGIKSLITHSELRILEEQCNKLLEERDDLINNIRILLANFYQKIDILNNSYIEIKGLVETMRLAIHRISDGITSQAIEIDRLSEGSESVQKASEQMMNETMEASIVAREVARFARAGRKSSNAALVRISAIALATDKTGNVVSDLRAKSDKIHIIIEDIHKILQHTKILSFNAGIEAARAGESGLGFTVIASEMGNLANGISNYAEQIGSLVGDIQKVTETTINSIGTVKQEVSFGKDIMEAANEVLLRVAEVITEADPTFAGLYKLATLQQEAIKDLSLAMEGIETIAKDNAKDAESVYNSIYNQVLPIEQLVNTINELKNIADILSKKTSDYFSESQE